MPTDQKLPASFRDPSGFVFTREGVLYRQVNRVYQPHYDALLASGLYERLVKAHQLIPHQEVDSPYADPAVGYKLLQPEPVALISYPYEWSFGQLKDAALLTLKVMQKALEAGLVLKDASAYNIQFHHGRPVLIDTLSFELYQEGHPWDAYRQFCQHFLAPLALVALRDVRLQQLLRVYIDGIPLDLAASLLPWKARLNLGLAVHLFTHAAAQKKYAGQAVQKTNRDGRMAKTALLGLVDNLKDTIRNLNWKPTGTEWGDYYDATNYSSQAFEDKKTLVGEFLARVQPATVWDLGANTGEFSQVAAAQGASVIAFDIDPAAVEKGYQYVHANKITNLLPLVLDLTNPSPALGWQNRERAGLTERGPTDLVLALALIHHLAISNNVPLPSVAKYFAHLGRYLVIEFVPKQDSQVQRLLASRADIFDQYTQAGFEAAFTHHFRILDTRPVEGSLRVLYLMEANQPEN